VLKNINYVYYDTKELKLNNKNYIKIPKLVELLNIDRRDKHFVNVRNIMLNESISTERDIGEGRIKEMLIDFDKLENLLFSLDIYVLGYMLAIKKRDPVSFKI